MNVSEGSPETMSSSPVKGCWGLASGGGVSDLSSDSGRGTYGPGLKFIDRDNLGPGRGDKRKKDTKLAASMVVEVVVVNLKMIQMS